MTPQELANELAEFICVDTVKGFKKDYQGKRKDLENCEEHWQSFLNEIFPHWIDAHQEPPPVGEYVVLCVYGPVRNTHFDKKSVELVDEAFLEGLGTTSHPVYWMRMPDLPDTGFGIPAHNVTYLR